MDDIRSSDLANAVVTCTKARAVREFDGGDREPTLAEAGVELEVETGVSKIAAGEAAG